MRGFRALLERLALVVLVFMGARFATRRTPAAQHSRRLVVIEHRSPAPSTQQQAAARALLGQPLPSPSLAALTGPTDNSNWLVPGHLIIGAKPTVVGAQALMAAGVTTFCSLVGEWSSEHYREREYPAGLAASSGGATLPTFLHFGIEDFDAPQPDELETLVLELRRRLLDGEVIYVHCRGGHGRSHVAGVIRCDDEGRGDAAAGERGEQGCGGRRRGEHPGKRERRR